MGLELLHSVKALIYRSDGQVLLQQRDHAANLPFPGHWTMFGGQVESMETLEEALARELEEELGRVPGPIGQEIFNWMWHGQAPVRNHCLPVYCEVDPATLELNEGQAMAWYAPAHIRHLNLIPGVRENAEKIVSFISSAVARAQDGLQ